MCRYKRGGDPRLIHEGRRFSDVEAALLAVVGAKGEASIPEKLQDHPDQDDRSPSAMTFGSRNILYQIHIMSKNHRKKSASACVYASAVCTVCV